MFLFKKDIILKEREKLEQSEGRKAVQWCNSTIPEEAELETQPGLGRQRQRTGNAVLSAEGRRGDLTFTEA